MGSGPSSCTQLPDVSFGRVMFGEACFLAKGRVSHVGGPAGSNLGCEDGLHSGCTAMCRMCV